VLEGKEEMEDKSEVLEAVLKEAVDLVIDLNSLKHFLVANSVCSMLLFVEMVLLG
jgi:hypothetical protein